MNTTGQRVQGQASIGDQVHYFDIANQNGEPLTVVSTPEQNRDPQHGWTAGYGLSDGSFSDLRQHGWTFVTPPQERAPMNIDILPTPTVTPGHGFEGNRIREIIYETARTDTVRGYTAIAVQVNVSHWKSSKSFTATAYPVSIEATELGITTSYLCSLMDGVRLKVSGRVDRFSAKALEAFTAEVVAEFPEMVKNSAKVQGLFHHKEG